MRVMVLHDPIAPNAAPEADDTRVQAEAVCRALAERGHEARTAATRGGPADLEALFSRFPPRRARADGDVDKTGGDNILVVFNLVESPEGRDAWASRVPAWLRRRRIPFTGSGAVALDATNDKPRAKRRMRRHNLPTPPWLDPAFPGSKPDSGGRDFAAGRYILKPRTEHASVGLDDGAVVDAATAEALRRALARRAARAGDGRELFAEGYVEGREFNVGLLEDAAGPLALPPAEIVFVDFPPDKPRIVGYDAKWRDDSFEYRHTVRRMDFGAADADLLARLRRLALDCWKVFNLKGYARVDFRVDSSGRAWVLEVNANPCLSPDAGFAAMLSGAGIAYARAVERIVMAGASGRRT